MTTLRNLILESGKSREEIAFTVGKTKQSIDNWCKGKSKPDKSNRDALSKILGVSSKEMEESISPT